MKITLFYSMFKNKLHFSFRRAAKIEHIHTLICAKPCASYAKIFAEHVSEKEKSSGTSQQLQFRCKLNENTKDVINFLIIFTFGANWFVNQTLRNCCAWFNEHAARRPTRTTGFFQPTVFYSFSICYEKSVRVQMNFSLSENIHTNSIVPKIYRRIEKEYPIIVVRSHRVHSICLKLEPVKWKRKDYAQMLYRQVFLLPCLNAVNTEPG